MKTGNFETRLVLIFCLKILL